MRIYGWTDGEDDGWLGRLVGELSGERKYSAIEERVVRVPQVTSSFFSSLHMGPLTVDSIAWPGLGSVRP